MKAVIFGATGMVGQGVLLECLRAPDVERVVTLGRTATGRAGSPLDRNANFEEIVHQDLMDLHAVEDRLRGLDACFFSLGVSSAGMDEAAYTRVTYGFTMAAAETLARLNPGMKFVFVSGAGTDSTEKGRVMWARVKGRAENALLRLNLDAYMFRPGVIEPLDGIRSKTTAYRVGYIVMKPVLPLLRWLLPNQILSTREIGQAMLNVARHGFARRVLEARAIRAAAQMGEPAR
jgi:uncharacterized protein YbjT (DUF2867 family)